MNKYLMNAQKLASEGNFPEAAELCRKSIKRGNDIIAAKKLLATCLYDIGLMNLLYGGLVNEAEENFKAAVELDPNHVDALNNLGAIFLQREHYDEAIRFFNKGLKADPSNIRLLENLSNAQRQSERMAEASETLLTLARIAPHDRDAYLIRDALLVKKVMPDQSYPVEIRKRIHEKLAAIETENITIHSPLRFSSTYFPLSYHGICNRDLCRRIANLHLKATPPLGWTAPHCRNWKGPQGKTRIGITSAFFRTHSIGNTSRGLVEHLDRNIFEVVLIRLGRSARDAMSDQMDKTADTVVLIESGDLPSAQKAIADLSLDILFYQDIGMEPMSYFLAFARLAPVQLTSFGHPDTTGIPNLDYFLSSENYEPAGSHEHYSEKLITVPNAGTLSYYYRPRKPATEFGRDLFGLNANDRIYLCPQSLFKIHPEMDEIFSGILERDDAARIVLIEPLPVELRIALEQRMSTVLQGHMNRVIFIKSLPYDEYLNLIRNADVILDTLHFNGQNTSLEAFAMGIPVVTMPGSMQRGRHTYGMYLSMGFLDLVATDGLNYVETAVKIATDPEYRNYCRMRIAEACDKLFENLDFVRSCEQVFSRMIEERSAATNGVLS
jgi:protein O-GlcNAc transferase